MRSVRSSSVVLIAAGCAAASLAACSAGVDDGVPDSGRKDSGTDTHVADSHVADSAIDDTSVDDTSVDDTGAIDAPEDTTLADSGATTDTGVDATTDTGAPASPTAFYVLRVGDGAAALSSAATAGFLEKRALGDGALLDTIALPTTANAPQQRVTFAGSSSSEGDVTLSGDHRYVVLAGYDAALDTPSVVGTAAAARRVIARVSGAGVVDTSTSVDGAFVGSNVRGAASVDGASFWAAGTASSTTAGGVWFVPFGGATGTQILSAPSNVRRVGVFAGQLYATSAAGAFNGVFTVGSGLPTMAGQTATLLPGMSSTTGPSPYSFALLDLDASIAGADALFVCDDRVATGLEKYTLAAGTWTLAYAAPPATGVGCRGLTAFVDGGAARVLITGTDSKVYAFNDDAGATAPTLLATAGTNTAYRGIAIAPY